jgi:hypothetical protein
LGSFGGGIEWCVYGAEKNECAVSLASAIGQRRSDFALAVLYLSALICCQCFVCCKFARAHPDYFQRTAEVHSHDTRHKAELFVSACSLQISRLNPAVCVPLLYNALPAEIRSIRAYKRFVTALRKFVYEHRYYSAKEYFDAADVV